MYLICSHLQDPKPIRRRTSVHVFPTGGMSAERKQSHTEDSHQEEDLHPAGQTPDEQQ